MRVLEQARLRIGWAWRRVAARRGAVHPPRLLPARLVLRLDDPDLPGSLGEGKPFEPARWRRELVAISHWLGPVPVTIRALRCAATPEAADLVRFVHRLDCPVTLVTKGDGLDRAACEVLVDRGLERVRVLVGGLSEATGGVAAAQNFIAVRAERAAPLAVEVGLCWRSPTQQEARAVIGWARQIGADRVRIVPPWRAAEQRVDPGLLGELLEAFDGFVWLPRGDRAALRGDSEPDAEPGLPAGRLRGLLPCPVGGQRVTLTARGNLYACPFKTPIAPGGSTPDRWSSAAAHLREIRSCGRRCVHPELSPVRLARRSRDG